MATHDDAGSGAERRLGGYQLLKLLGRRRGVETYRARQVAVDRLVDLTALPPGASNRAASVLGFERALAATSRLQHDNVISAIDAGSVDGWRYFVTEHVEGETLAEALRRGEAFPVPRALAVAADVARALAHLEERGVVHRAVSPASIVLSAAGGVKLTGFASAKERSPTAAETWFDADTEAAAYYAPERIRGERGADVRADVYSLGCVLYRLVAGRTPFSGMSAALILDAHLGRRPRDPRTLIEGLDPGLVHVLDRCLRKTADARYTKVAEFVADLDALRAGRAPPTPDTGRKLWPSRDVRPARFRLERDGRGAAG